MSNKGIDIRDYISEEDIRKIVLKRVENDLVNFLSKSENIVGLIEEIIKNEFKDIFDKARKELDIEAIAKTNITKIIDTVADSLVYNARMEATKTESYREIKDKIKVEIQGYVEQNFDSIFKRRIEIKSKELINNIIDKI